VKKIKLFTITLLLLVSAFSAVVFANSNKAVITAQKGLLLRDNPNRGAKALVLIPQGYTVDIISESDNTDTIKDITSPWYKVSYGGYHGWIFGGFTEKTGAADTDLGFNPLYVVLPIALIAIIAIVIVLVLKNKGLKAGAGTKAQKESPKPQIIETPANENKPVENQQPQKKATPVKNKVIIGNSIGIIILIFLILSCHIVIGYGDIGIKIFTKDHLTLENTIITPNTVEKLLTKYNNASFFEKAQIIGEPLFKKLMDEGILYRVNEPSKPSNSKRMPWD
jgi:hypothetical protein